MAASDIQAAVAAIIRDELQDDGVVLSLHTETADIPGWDSVSMSCVIIAIEKRFQVRFDSEDMDRIVTIGDFIGLIERRTGSQPAVRAG